MLLDATAFGRTARVEVRARPGGGYVVTIDGRPVEVDLDESRRDFLSLIVDGRSYEVGLQRRQTGYTVVLADDAVEVELADAARGAVVSGKKAHAGPIKLTAPMPGKVVRVLVPVGEAVTSGQGLVVMEAMKMENELKAARDGRVKTVAVTEGQSVESGALLVVVE